MAVREIVHYPAEVLKTRSKPVTKFGKSLRSLVADMFDTIYEFDGVGLAAPQVAAERVVLVNPKITARKGKELGEEGCLSLPDLYGYVSRATDIDVTAVDCDGDVLRLHASGFFARIIQHEIDHINGVVFVDRLELDERERKIQEYDKLRTAATAAAEGN